MSLRELMDKNGMLPSGLTCRSCGRELDNGTKGRAAELYLGTFNGLCYSCTGSKPFVEKVYIHDGALVVSAPPSCPSWRRDRTTHFAFRDCETCSGRGFRVVHRSMTSGAHTESCKKCVKRFCTGKRNRETKSVERLLAKYQKRYEKEREGLDQQENEALRKVLLAEFEEAKGVLLQKTAYLHETREPTNEERVLVRPNDASKWVKGFK